MAAPRRWARFLRRSFLRPSPAPASRTSTATDRPTSPSTRAGAFPAPKRWHGRLCSSIQRRTFHRSQSAVGVCFFEGDIVYAIRQHDNDNLNVAFYGSGATPWPTGDFDDIGHIRDYGLSRSIRGFGR